MALYLVTDSNLNEPFSSPVLFLLQKLNLHWSMIQVRGKKFIIRRTTFTFSSSKYWGICIGGKKKKKKSYPCNIPQQKKENPINIFVTWRTPLIATLMNIESTRIENFMVFCSLGFFFLNHYNWTDAWKSYYCVKCLIGEK